MRLNGTLLNASTHKVDVQTVPVRHTRKSQVYAIEYGAGERETKFD